MRRYGAAWLMIAFAATSMVIHLWFGWRAAVDEAATHGQAATAGQFLVEWTRDTFENWQSEFVQLAVQFALLAGFFRFLGVHAHEEDQEELKSMVRELLAKQQATTETSSGWPPSRPERAA